MTVTDKTLTCERILLRAENLFGPSYSAVFGYAYRLTSSKEEAAKLVANAFLELNRELAKRRMPDRFPHEQMLAQTRRIMRAISLTGKLSEAFSDLAVHEFSDLHLLDVSVFHLDPVTRHLYMLKEQGATPEEAFTELTKYEGCFQGSPEAKRHLHLGIEGIEKRFAEWDLGVNIEPRDRASP